MQGGSEILNRDSDDYTSHSVVLPCEPEHFRDFVAGLLGKPQTISRRLFGRFELTKSDVENLYHLIEQRVSSQNEATLIQFSATVAYDDNSSVRLNSFPDFQVYKEVKPLVSTTVSLSWTYLIKFRTKKFPERQQIDLTFKSGADSDHDSFALSSARMKEIAVSNLFRIGLIDFRIHHTDRTWGTDIEGLLDGQLHTLLKEENGIREIVSDWSSTIGFFAGVFSFVAALLGVVTVTRNLIGRYLEQASKLASSDTQTFDAVVKKLDFLIDIIASGFWTKYAFYATGYFLIAIIASIIIGFVIGAAADNKLPSFVLLTKGAEERKSAVLTRYNSNWLYFIAQLIGTLIVAIFGNYLFYIISQNWTL